MQSLKDMIVCLILTEHLNYGRCCSKPPHKFYSMPLLSPPFYGGQNEGLGHLATAHS
jgi:hypothetical protein